jgi:hypothetical protein
MVHFHQLEIQIMKMIKAILKVIASQMNPTFSRDAQGGSAT